MNRTYDILHTILIVLSLTIALVYTTMVMGATGVNVDAKSYVVASRPSLLFAPSALLQTQAKPARKWFEGIRYSGNARFYGYYRHMDKYYDTPSDYLGGLTMPFAISAGDGIQQPLLLLAMEANPSAASKFKLELNFDHLLLRQTYRTDVEGRLANLFVIFQFQGEVDTRLGHMSLISGGGINWYRISPSTFWGYQYRDDLFERYPWEPEGHDFNRYSSFYYQGDIPRDARFGMQPTQGYIFEMTGMPHGIDVAVLYGKNTQTGGFQSYLVRNPQRMLAGRIGKTMEEHKLGFNFMSQGGHTNNKVDYTPVIQESDTFYVEGNYTNTTIATADVRLKFKNMDIYAEAGAGSYVNNIYNEGLRSGVQNGAANISRYARSWDETFFAEVSTNKRLTHFPMKFNVFRIGKGVVNTTSSTLNSSVEQATSSPDVPSVNNLDYYDGLVGEVGQLTNNRHGANLFAFMDFKKLKTKFGLGFAQEIENLVGDTRNGARAETVAGVGADSVTRVPFTNSITFHQRLNGVTRSRFTFYRRFSGPYSRINTTFRRTFENIVITDTLVDYKKSFSNLELTLKYKTKVGGKDMVLTNYTDFSSVQEKWSPIPVFSDKAFLRYFYEEFMAFYAIWPKVTLVSFAGIERATGNMRTELADENGDLITDANGRPIANDNGKPIDQLGYGVGLGLDYNFDARASIHFRSRWYAHKDRSFTRDEFSGHDMTIEFKKFF